MLSGPKNNDRNRIAMNWAQPFNRFQLSLDGIRLHGVQQGPPSDSPIVFLHGNPTWSYLYRHILAPLAEDGFRVLAYDHMGFGRSSKPADPSSYSFSTHYNHLLDVLDRQDVPRPILVGHDWGGPMTLQFALDFPDRIRALILINTGTFVRKPLLTLLRLSAETVVGDLLYRKLNLFVELHMRLGVFQRQRLRPEVMRYYRLPFRPPNSRAGMLAFPRMIPLTSNHDNWDRFQYLHTHLSDIKCPTLLLAGQYDPVFGRRTAQMFHRNIPNTCDHILSRAGHYCQEEQPARIARLIKRFVNSL